MPEIYISKDKSKLKIEFITNFLQNAYWAKGRSVEAIKVSIENSLCFGVYINAEQIGFARIITDYAVYAYLMDVFIDERYRGNGYGEKLVHFIICDQELSNVPQWGLGTSDAHKLYEKFGFKHVGKEENLMRRLISQ